MSDKKLVQPYPVLNLLNVVNKTVKTVILNPFFLVVFAIMLFVNIFV